MIIVDLYKGYKPIKCCLKKCPNEKQDVPEVWNRPGTMVLGALINVPSKSKISVYLGLGFCYHWVHVIPLSAGIQNTVYKVPVMRVCFAGKKAIRGTSNMGNWLRTDWKKNKEIYFILFPVVLYYLLFCYKPMYGVLIAFQNYSPGDSIIGGNWVGFKHFISFFKSYYFQRLLTNTLSISLTSILFGFPAPILLALMLNELRSKLFSRVTQITVYLPHFISMVVICGMLKDFVKDGGIINILISYLGFETQNMLQNPSLFVPLYVISGIWESVGWGSIIYLAALTGVDQELYEAARIDGAGRWKQTIHITIPAIVPTIIIMFIMRTGTILSVGSEKILLLYNPTTYETADVISTFVYRKGILEGNFSYSTAVGLFNSIVNFGLVFLVNKISSRVSETSLW